MPQRCFEVAVNGGTALMLTDDDGLPGFPQFFDLKGTPLVPTTSVDCLSGDLPLPSWWVPVTVPAPPTPPSAPSRTVSRKTFLVDLLGLPVVAKVTELAQRGDSMLGALLLVVQTTEPITLDDPATMQGLGYLESLGVLTADDVTRILAGV